MSQCLLACGSGMVSDAAHWSWVANTRKYELLLLQRSPISPVISICEMTYRYPYNADESQEEFEPV